LPFEIATIDGGKGIVGHWHPTWGPLRIGNVTMNEIVTNDSGQSREQKIESSND
jgi:hypothetical protein